MSSSVTEIHLAVGDVLYREGDPNDFGYVIESGEVLLFREVDGQRINVETRKSGSLIGELSILTGHPRAVTVEALTPCKVFRIPAEQILTRYQNLDPMLRACVETSINFISTFTQQSSDPTRNVPESKPSLENIDEFIEILGMETGLTKGLTRGEFRLEYQPIVRLDDASVMGAEALVRWTHPKLGRVSPDRFIPIAEEMGSISKLTEFALFEAAGTLGRILDDRTVPRDFFIAVNISGMDIDREDFVDLLSHIIDLNGLEPHNLKLEVTETALMPRSGVATANLERLRDLGFGISIDDFGTGYSNLSYLKLLPLTTLKIDRSLAGDAHLNAVSKSIVRVLVALGRELGVDVVAEGLETEDDVKTLLELGCCLAQGYYFSRPIPEEELVMFLSGGVAERKSASSSH